MTARLDTHQHLIYTDVAVSGWTDKTPPLANKSFTLEAYRDLSEGADIVGSLFMETGVDNAHYRVETSFVADLAKESNNAVLGVIASCRPEHAAIQPYVDHVFETFDADRMVWGSEWPVVDLGHGLLDWIGVTQKFLSQLSKSEADAVGAKNAVNIYGVSS